MLLFCKILLVLSAGAINGILGGGGGMIVVPMLVWLFAMKQKNAQATAVLIMIATSVGASIGYFKYMSGNWMTLLYVAIGAIVGTVVGAIVLKKAKNEWLEIAFAFLMTSAGILMILKGSGVIG